MGIKYRLFDVDVWIDKANIAQEAWRKLTIQQRADILIDTLEGIKSRFFDIALATQHTIGKSFMMGFHLK